MKATSCICGGYGWYTACNCDIGELSHCPDFGKAFPCVCKLQQQSGSYRRSIAENSGLTPFARSTFTMHTFDPGRHEDAPDMFQAAADMLTGKGKPWLVLLGTPGAGKSHLAMAICNGLVAQGVGARFTTAARMLERLRCADMGQADPTDDQVYQISRLYLEYEKAPVLIVDDIRFDVITTEAQLRYLENVIDRRYDNRAPSVFTSNQIEEELPGRIGSRMTDRLLARVLHVAPPDQRQAA